MNDMAQTIIPKSDQLNSDDLIAGPLTITVTGVDIRSGQEQPISIHYEGDKGKPYKACKSMCRVMVTAWGSDSKKYVGRSMTLYRDPAVKWGGMEVGGIRISHMSHIDESMTMALTVTRSNRKPFTVKPLASGAKAREPAATPYSQTSTEFPDARPGSSASAAAYISPEQVIMLETLCNDGGISVDALKKKGKVERLAMLEASRFDGCVAWIKAAIAARQEVA